MDEFLLYHRALNDKEAKYLSTGPVNPFAVDPQIKLATNWGHLKVNQ